MRALVITLLAASIGAHVVPAAANELCKAKTKEALAMCDQVEHLAGRQAKLDHLDKAILIGEAAVAADDNDGRAHFALFCNLAKQVELSGLSWRVLGRLHRMQEEIDRALALEPNDADVLVAKGELLRELPRPLGGDRTRGTQYLLRALEIRPDHVAARLYVARAMKDDGAPDARARAYEALALAKKVGATREQVQAQQLLASIDD